MPRVGAQEQTGPPEKEDEFLTLEHFFPSPDV